MFGKLWEARSRLYRRRCLQVKYAFESSWRDLQGLHTFAPLESNWKTKKNASGKHPPDEATAPNSKIQLNFVKEFRIFAILFSKCAMLIIFCKCSPKLKIPKVWWTFFEAQTRCLEKRDEKRKRRQDARKKQSISGISAIFEENIKIL